MSSIATKWDNIFAQQNCDGQAADVLAQHLHLLPTSGCALDLACGLGGNAICLAQHGFDVHAWDVSQIALDKVSSFANERGLNIQTKLRDVENNPPETNQYDVITVSNFLYRPIFTKILASLRQDGLLFYQTFIAEKSTQVGPSNPDYLLMRNELLAFCMDMNILVYREEGLQGDVQKGWRNQAMIIAKN